MEEVRSTYLFKALEEPKVVRGVEYNLVLLNCGVLAFMCLSLKFYWWIGAFVLLHLILKNLTKKDPAIKKVYSKYVRQADRYEPWPTPYRYSGFRSNGFGRNNIC